MSDPLATLLPLGFLLVALLYSSVGHAGATGYLALMALAGIAPETMRPTALVLNLAVASIAVVRYARADLLPWRTLGPFVVDSVLLPNLYYRAGRDTKYGPDVLTRVSMIGNDLALDPGVGTCGKEGQSVPVGVGQPTLRIDGLTVGGTA